MRKKVLLMGRSGAGKTSMRSIIFANYLARDTKRLGPTIDIEHSHVRFLNNLVLNLWDCGGQDGFMESYFQNTRGESLFKNVEVLIYVMDAETRNEETGSEMHYLKQCLDHLARNGQLNARIFCLVHKMDLINEDERDTFLMERVRQIERTCAGAASGVFARGGRAGGGHGCVTFGTSIWDESLFKAWSQIVQMLLPNASHVGLALNRLADALDADELILFEKSTFLVIARARGERFEREPNRLEKVSNIVKHFKISCSKMRTMFSSMLVRNTQFIALIQSFTTNTYIMVVHTDPTVTDGAMELNITNARKQFEQLEKMEPDQQQQHKQHAQAQLAPGGGGVPPFVPSPVMPMPVTSLGAPPFATQPAVAANGAPLAGVGVPHAQIFSATGGAYLPGQSSQMLMPPMQQQLPPALAADQPN